MESVGKQEINDKKRCYSIEFIKKYVIGPAQKFLTKADPDKDPKKCMKLAHQAHYHLKGNEEHLYDLCNGIKEEIFSNEKEELKTMIEEFNETIESLKRIVVAYNLTVDGEVGLINKSSIKAHLGNLEHNNNLIDEINFSYMNPLNDMVYGKKIRLLFSELDNVIASNSTSLLSKCIKEVKYYLNGIMTDVSMNGEYPTENELITVQSDFEKLLKLYENLLNEKSSD